MVYIVDKTIDDIQKIIEWLANKHWWPFRNTEHEKLAVRELFSTDKITALLIEDSVRKVVVPLAVSHEKPVTADYLRINDKYIFEAEYLRNYWEELGRVCDIKQYVKIYGKTSSVHLLTRESTHLIVTHELSTGDSIVVKGYRHILPLNIEEKYYETILGAGYKYAPKPLVSINYQGIPIGIVIEYIDNTGDATTPFRKAFEEKVGKASLKLGLAAKLGSQIAGLHLALNSTSNDFSGKDRISQEDIRRWSNRIQRRYKDAVRLLEKLVDNADGKRKTARYEKWLNHLDLLRENVEKAISYLEAYIDSYKIRTHQDLHLLQVLYGRDENFYFIDFEGEPGRARDELLEKEPPLRDIAVMIRSFQYLSYELYMSKHKLTRTATSDRLLRNDPLWDWRMRHSLSMLLSYLSTSINADLHGIPREIILTRYNDLLYPWLVDRGLYEIIYEATYNPDRIPIPLIGLVNPSIPINT